MVLTEEQKGYRRVDVITGEVSNSGKGGIVICAYGRPLLVLEEVGDGDVYQVMIRPVEGEMQPSRAAGVWELLVPT